MNVYLVRHQETCELVGIFAAHTREMLMDLVDQVTDPNICECRKMDEGGIMWERRAKRVPPAALPDPYEDPKGFNKVYVGVDGGSWDERWCSEINELRPNRAWRPVVKPGKSWGII